MCVNISGSLRRPIGSIKGEFKTKEGYPLSDYGARALLRDELAKGHKVFPVGDCDNFDYQKGCQGHE